MERSAEYFDLENSNLIVSHKFLFPTVQHFNYELYAGLEYSFDISKPIGERVTKLLYQGKPIGEHRLKMCVTDYRASGTGGYGCYKKCPVLRRFQADVFSIALDYLKKHPDVQVESRTRITVVF